MTVLLDLRMKPFELRWLSLAMMCLWAACSDGADVDEPESPTSWTASGPGDGEQACNPLSRDWDCLLPFPSDFLRVVDDSLASGHRIHVPGAAQPQTKQGAGMDLLAQYPIDGFSILSQIAVLIPGGMDDGPLAGPTEDPAESLKPDHATLILDAITGAPVAHISEVDPRPHDVDDRAVVIRPLVPLQHDRRYVVVVQGLSRPGGAAIAAPTGYAALRDGDDGAPARLSAYFEHRVFPVLEKAGVTRDATLLAWDFTTGTATHLRADLLAMRSQVLQRLAESAPAVAIDLVEKNPTPDVARWIEGTVEVPMFLDGEGAGARLVRDDQGVPTASDAAVKVPFAALIPAVTLASAATRTVRVVQLGHGFFGGRDELNSGASRQLLHRMGAVGFALDWWGLSLIDSGTVVADIAGAPEQALRFVDRLHQAMANQLVLADAMRTAIPALPAFDLAGTTIPSSGPVQYSGNSLGHILGGTYVAIAPRVERAALGVGGAGFGMIMPRSVAFAQLLGVVNVRMADRLETLKAQLILQMGLDRIDPVVWADEVRVSQLADSPKVREVLLHTGIGDTSVPDMTAHVHARALGIGHLQPAPRAIWGLKPVTGPHAGSALVEFDFGVPDPAPTARSPKGPNKVHEAVRHLEAVISQLDAFLRVGGKVVQTCDGPCDPE